MAAVRTVARPESSHPEQTMAAAGSEGYSQQMASPEKKPRSGAAAGRSGPGQNAPRYAEPRQSAASWWPANIWPYVKDIDPSAPARTHPRATGPDAPRAMRNRLTTTQKTALGRMHSTQRSTKT